MMILFIRCNNHKSFNLIDNDILSLVESSKNRNIELNNQIEFINKAYKLVNKYPLDSLTLEIISHKSTVHYNFKQIDSAFYYDKLLLQKSQILNSSYFMGKASLRIGYYFKSHQVYDSAYYYYNRSKNYFQKIKDSSQIGRRLLVMAQIQQDQNDYFGSKETITEALEYLRSQKDIKYRASSYNALATNHRKLLNKSDAIKYYRKAIEITSSKKDKLIYENNLATAFIDNKDFDKAINLLKSNVIDSLFQNNSKEYARSLDNLTYAKWLKTGNNLEYQFFKALNIRKKNNEKRGQIASYTHLGEYYSKKNPRKAIAYFDSVIRLSKTLKIPRAEKDAIKYLIKLEPTNIKLRDRYVFLQDSLYAQELKVKTQFAKYKYDDKQKQESILRLQKETAEKDLAYTKERYSKIVYLSAFIIACLITVSVSYFYKKRAEFLKQENKLEIVKTIYKTEAELSRRLHDDFGAKINHSMLLVQNNTDKSKLLDTLDELYNQSRDFSREINEIETGSNYKNELLEMLSAYTSTKIKLYTAGSKEVDWTTLNALNKTVLYKVLRELMLNMAKYSNATAVKITFKKTLDSLQINYSDNGVGASEMAMNNKNGLKNTEKRIQAIRGTIIFDTKKGKGFKAEIKIPN